MEKKLQIFVISLTLLVTTIAKDCNKEKHKMAKLKEDILCNYEKTLPPTIHQGNATSVSISMILKSFNYYDYSGMTVNSWLALVWKDARLKWDPDDYDSIKTIHIASSEIWIPDLSIYNGHDQSSTANVISAVDCILYSSGAIVCVSPTSQSALCIPDVTRYPFDVQNCSLRVGSWVHSGEVIDFKLASPSVSLEDYVPNGIWRLVKVNATRHSGKFECCPNNTYPSLIYQFIIERYAGSHVATIIVPAVVMMIITLTSLWLNPIEMERLSVTCCSLLCHVLYAEFITWQIPGNGDKAPLLTLFARDSLLLNGFALLITVVLKKMMQFTIDIPTWIPSIVSVLVSNRAGQMLFMRDYYVKDTILTKNEEDGTNIVENTENKTNDWAILVKVIDRLCFIIYVIVYIFIIVAFVP